MNKRLRLWYYVIASLALIKLKKEKKKKALIYLSHRPQGNVKIYTVAQIHTSVLSIPFKPYNPKSPPLALICNRSVASVGPSHTLAARLLGCDEAVYC